MVNPHRRYRPVPFTAVMLNDDFWAPRLRVNRERTLAIELEQCRRTGRIEALRLQWRPGQKPEPHIFWDSDVAKWLEAASYSLATHPDAQLEAQVDEVVALLAAAQQPDGYLNSHFTSVEPERRWTNLRDRHELYCAGHLIEAGVAHYQATGQRALLDVVARYADHIGAVFGLGPGQKRGYSGHEEIELALVKLYRVTGERRYLALSQYLVDERGRQPHYFDLEAWARGEDPAAYWAARNLPPEMRYSYMQAHEPVREQREVTGHAVRAMYLYSAMADLAVETGDESLLAACRRLWHHLCDKNLYITGGIGPSGQNEGFTRDYDLPNESAYAETCASIGLVFWSHRMLQSACDRRYADVMERALYNGVLSGVSLDGERFFYENPLASTGSFHRQPWFDCACCPPNLARLLASLGGYLYSQGEGELAVHLYAQSQARLAIDGQNVLVRQVTRYPWEGRVSLRLELERPLHLALRLRRPGWCREAGVKLNGAAVEPSEEQGYWRLERDWHPGDEVTLELAMPVERYYAHPDVRQDAGHVALGRGPLVYCVEAADVDVPLERLRLPAAARLEASSAPDLLGGVVVLRGEAEVARGAEWEETLYRTAPAGLAPCTLAAVPYFAWDNRTPGAMRVWVPEVSS